MANALLITDAAMCRHNPGPGHPERPARLQAILDMLEALTIENVERRAPTPAHRSQIDLVHAADYIDQIESLHGRSVRLDADTSTSADSVEAAYLAAGAAVDAVEAVCASAAPTSDHQVTASPSSRAFALVRPPGHHAERDRAMGFCLFNNVAVAAAHAIEQLGIERVLIIDWDVHHGNGTQHIFQDRRDVLYFSSHQSPLYPGTGSLHEVGVGEGEGFTVNAPLPAGSDDALHVEVYRRLLAPIAESYHPQLVLVSAGFDAHRDDPLAGMRMTEAGFAALCGLVRDVADRVADGRLALFLEGGYNLTALAGGVKACIEVLAGASPPVISPIGPHDEAIIDEICSAHRRFWPI